MTCLPPPFPDAAASGPTPPAPGHTVPSVPSDPVLTGRFLAWIDDSDLDPAAMLTALRHGGPSGPEQVGRVDAADELFDTVVESIDREGSLGKTDIAALVLWKNSRPGSSWSRALNATPDSVVRALTAEAVANVRDRSLSPRRAATQARLGLVSLPGFRRGDGLASAVLYAAAPDRMAVYEKATRRHLERFGLVLAAPGRYGRYVELLTVIATYLRGATAHSWTPNEVGVALRRLQEAQETAAHRGVAP